MLSVVPGIQQEPDMCLKGELNGVLSKSVLSEVKGCWDGADVPSGVGCVPLPFSWCCLGQETWPVDPHH